MRLAERGDVRATDRRGLLQARVEADARVEHEPTIQQGPARILRDTRVEAVATVDDTGIGWRDRRRAQAEVRERRAAMHNIAAVALHVDLDLVDGADIVERDVERRAALHERAVGLDASLTDAVVGV
jgi:hypothetical protein